MAKPKMTVSPMGPNDSVSFPSTGPVSDGTGGTVTSDHSVLTDVAGEQVWLHKDKHHFDGKHVHMPFHHAVDMGLADQEKAQDPVSTSSQTDSVQTTKLEPGKSGHDAKTYKEDDKGKVTPTTSAMSNTGTDNARTKQTTAS